MPTSSRRLTLPVIVPLHIEFSQERDVEPVHIHGRPDAVKIGPWRPEVRLKVIDVESRSTIEFEVEQDGSCESTVTPMAALTDADREFLRRQRDAIDTLLTEEH